MHGRSLLFRGKAGPLPIALVPPAFATNPPYTSFPLRATGATLACYLIITGLDWGGIHTCMVICAATALVTAEAQVRKQALRITGAFIGGARGIAAVVWVISNFNSLFALLLVVAAGSGAVTDPFVSFDAQWIVYAYFPDIRFGAYNPQRELLLAGADIYRLIFETPLLSADSSGDPTLRVVPRCEPSKQPLTRQFRRRHPARMVTRAKRAAGWRDVP